MSDPTSTGRSARVPVGPARAQELRLADGRRLRVYETATRGTPAVTVLWHHGTPNLGAPPAPLVPAAAARGIRFVSYDRPGYGGSTARAGRAVASAAADVATIADALAIERFAVMGHSGGASHALACAALLPDRVLAVVSVAALAERATDGLDWYAGMHPAGAAKLRAAAAGRASLDAHLASTEFDPDQFTSADHAALTGPWTWLAEIAAQALADNTGGPVDDDLAYVAPWGADPARIRAPTLLVHGEQDRIVPAAHARSLARRIPNATLWLEPGEGHVSSLRAGERALDWLRQHGD